MLQAYIEKISDSKNLSDKLEFAIIQDSQSQFELEINFSKCESKSLAWLTRKFSFMNTIGAESRSNFYITYYSRSQFILAICCSHLLMDGFSIQLFWEKLEQEINKRRLSKFQLRIDNDKSFELTRQCSRLLFSTKTDIIKAASKADFSYWSYIQSMLPILEDLSSSIKISRRKKFYDFNEESKFAQYFGSLRKGFTFNENFIVNFATLFFETTKANILLISIPVYLKSLNKNDSLGYFVDSRPLIIERDDFLDDDIHSIVRSSIKRMSSLEVSWKNYMEEIFCISKKNLSRVNGILISNFYKPNKLKAESIRDSGSVNDLNLFLKNDNTIARQPVRKQSVVELSPHFSYQRFSTKIRIISNLIDINAIIDSAGDK